MIDDDDEFDDETDAPDELAEEDLDAELEDEELEPEDLDDEDLELADDDDDVLVEETDDDEEEGLDLEEELHPDDVEEPLDVLLLERTSSGLLDEDEDEVEDEDEEAEIDDRADGAGRILPKRPGEFVCRSCFLVKHPSQLADADRQLCLDCV